MGYVLTMDTRPAGILRWPLLWDSIPFCNLLYIKEEESLGREALLTLLGQY